MPSDLDYTPGIIDRFYLFFVCKRKGHFPMLTESGYAMCGDCGQSLDYDTDEGLGWYGYNYFPEGYV